MNFPKYDGNIHPDEWINDIRTYYHFSNNQNHIKISKIKYAISLVNATIKLPTGIDNFDKLLNALKEDISFSVFKNTNKRKMKLLKYIPEREGGETSKFISKFRQLCYNAEINDIEEQKKYLNQSLSLNPYLFNEFSKRKDKIHSINVLIKEFEEIAMDESNLIRNGSVVTLKHVATGQYLSSIKNFRYTTGSKNQMVFANNCFNSDALWRISFVYGHEGPASYADTTIHIYLQHKNSNLYFGIYNCYNSPTTNHTEASCDVRSEWKFNNSKLENYQGYLKSNDIINLSTYRNQQVFLRSHDFQFTIGNDTFQEVVCHNERLGGNDEWCIELI